MGIVTLEQRFSLQVNARQFLCRGLGLTRNKLRAENSPAYRLWREMKDSKGRRPKPERSQLRDWVLEVRHELYRGNDSQALLQTAEIEQIIQPGNSHFDYLVHLHCQEIIRDIGQPWKTGAGAALLGQARAVAEGWAVLGRHYLELATAIAAMAHVHRSNAIVFGSDSQYATAQAKLARSLIARAGELVTGYRHKYPRKVADFVMVQIAFQKLRIAVETGDGHMAEAAMHEMDESGSDEVLDRLDLLRGRISYLLSVGNKEAAEEALAEAWKIYNSLEVRSPYTFFSLGYREAVLRGAQIRPTAKRDVVASYFEQWNQYPQAFTCARMLTICDGEIPVPVIRPEVYAVRTSAHYMHDELVRL